MGTVVTLFALRLQRLVANHSAGSHSPLMLVNALMALGACQFAIILVRITPALRTKHDLMHMPDIHHRIRLSGLLQPAAADFAAVPDRKSVV